MLYDRTPAWVKSDYDKLLVVPRSYIPDLLHTAHDSVWGAHHGIKRTCERLSSVYSAPKLKQFCKLPVQSCDSCQIHIYMLLTILNRFMCTLMHHLQLSVHGSVNTILKNSCDPLRLLAKN